MHYQFRVWTQNVTKSNTNRVWFAVVDWGSKHAFWGVQLTPFLDHLRKPSLLTPSFNNYNQRINTVKKKNKKNLNQYRKGCAYLPLTRPRTSKVKARSGGQPAQSKVVVRGIFHSMIFSLIHHPPKTHSSQKLEEREREREKIEDVKPYWFASSLKGHEIL